MAILVVTGLLIGHLPVLEKLVNDQLLEHHSAQLLTQTLDLFLSEEVGCASTLLFTKGDKFIVLEIWLAKGSFEFVCALVSERQWGTRHWQWAINSQLISEVRSIFKQASRV